MEKEIRIHACVYKVRRPKSPGHMLKLTSLVSKAAKVSTSRPKSKDGMTEAASQTLGLFPLVHS